ncbi:hypothetical protein M2103_001695 [Ereboglobus sp. PH5-5]|uniref:hypothetical protein n=1 Tax=Ereboglobus sp. PH5-5 TaxID=2940529 RepID=UPI0024077223|nr:hypothetical protein [Ereboglobus sp. PH5-5]MDF9833471.1 hypothetical protein [Ereboglobus sp. PH5-5]
MHSGSGLHDAYLDTFDDKVWGEVDGLIRKYKSHLIDRIWEVFAQTCDLAPDGTAFEIEPRKCYRCKSTSLSHSVDNVGVAVDVPAVTHIAWFKLTDEEKRSRILAVY